MLETLFWIVPGIKLFIVTELAAMMKVAVTDTVAAPASNLIVVVTPSWVGVGKLMVMGAVLLHKINGFTGFAIVAPLDVTICIE